jgi:hypothetical protein
MRSTASGQGQLVWREQQAWRQEQVWQDRLAPLLQAFPPPALSERQSRGDSPLRWEQRHLAREELPFPPSASSRLPAAVVEPAF